ncbi:hypothetical protein [Synechococcus sp. PCC 7336]|uniref:hypothetical protein n=1 Tax=Synechococcus sp. PCC 7336 TaxID=195250 RepID=UPI00034CAC63|nr:hypothetical protein [Synechococcus sp. PCC 7336]
MKHDPYACLGLRGNPFILEETPGAAAGTWIDRGISPPQPGQNTFVQLQADRGAGKTSHLLHWRSQYPGPYSYYPIEVLQRWHLPAVDAIAYWDEADRIPLPLLLAGLARAASANATIAVGTHVDLAWAARWMGFRVERISLPPMDAATLQVWAARKIAAATLPDMDSSGLALEPAIAVEIARAAGHSWREAADRLHIWAARQARFARQNRWGEKCMC